MSVSSWRGTKPTQAIAGFPGGPLGFVRRPRALRLHLLSGETAGLGEVNRLADAGRQTAKAVAKQPATFFLPPLILANLFALNLLSKGGDSVVDDSCDRVASTATSTFKVRRWSLSWLRSPPSRPVARDGH